MTSVAQHFRTVYNEIVRNTTRPNVLVAGTTGAGKSSLINSIFGRQLAQEGAGEPITTHFTRYAPDDARVVIYDSRGLEHGNTDAFIESTREFVEQLAEGGSLEDSIHVVWYVINGAGSRIQPFEEELVKTLFSSVPLMFLINKADISSDEDRAILRQTLTAMNVPSCMGIFDTVSGAHDPLLNVTKCPKCGSDDINIRKKRGIATCENCLATISLLVRKEDVVAKTLEILPAVAREAFIAAQKFSVMHKEGRAKLIIREYYEQCVSIRFAKTLLKEIARMLVRLAMLWDFREQGSMLGTELAQDLLRRELSFRDKLVFFLRKCKGERDRTTAVGVLWNRALRKIFITIFVRCAEAEVGSPTPVLNGSTPAPAQPQPQQQQQQQQQPCEQCDWHAAVHSSFMDLNEAELTAVAEEISKKGLDAVLDHEMSLARPGLLSGAISPPQHQQQQHHHGSSSPLAVSTSSVPGLSLPEKSPPQSPRQQASTSDSTSARRLTPGKPPTPAASTMAAAASATGEERSSPRRPLSREHSGTLQQPPPQQLPPRKMSLKDKDKDKGLRLDPEDIAEIEHAARIESEQTALQIASERENAKKRAALTTSQIGDDGTWQPRSRTSIDGGRPRTQISAPIPIASSASGVHMAPMSPTAVSLPTTTTLFQHMPGQSPQGFVGELRQHPPSQPSQQQQQQPLHARPPSAALMSQSEPPKTAPQAAAPPPPPTTTTAAAAAAALQPQQKPPSESVMSTSPRYVLEEGAHQGAPHAP